MKYVLHPAGSTCCIRGAGVTAPSWSGSTEGMRECARKHKIVCIVQVAMSCQAIQWCHKTTQSFSSSCVPLGTLCTLQLASDDSVPADADVLSIRVLLKHLEDIVRSSRVGGAPDVDLAHELQQGDCAHRGVAALFAVQHSPRVLRTADPQWTRKRTSP